MIDLDNSCLSKAVLLSKMLIRDYPSIGDCLILKSSDGTHRITVKPQCEPNKIIHYNRDNYMLVFNNIITYDLVCHIIEILAHLDIVDQAYFEIRKFRGDITLRVSSKSYSDRFIPPPERVAYVYHDSTCRRFGMILEFEKYLDIMKRIEATPNKSLSPLFSFFDIRWCWYTLNKCFKYAFSFIRQSH